MANLDGMVQDRSAAYSPAKEVVSPVMGSGQWRSVGDAREGPTEVGVVAEW